MKTRDFTIQAYDLLLRELQKQSYKTSTYSDFIENYQPGNKTVILRHDVDRKSGNALKMAKLESDTGVKASYYFRITRNSYNEDIIREIAGMGHEIGYHYEDLSFANGDKEKAIEMFRENLAKFRALYPVKTICMHGSPMSKWDNRDLWEKYDYREDAIIGEPYFDIDFEKLFYITDASRTWNNEKITKRDKVHSSLKFDFKNLEDIMILIRNKKLPDQLMVNVHPHNWSFSAVEWFKIMLWQGLKNIIKFMTK